MGTLTLCFADSLGVVHVTSLHSLLYNILPVIFHDTTYRSHAALTGTGGRHRIFKPINNFKFLCLNFKSSVFLPCTVLLLSFHVIKFSYIYVKIENCTRFQRQFQKISNSLAQETKISYSHIPELVYSRQMQAYAGR